MRRVPHDNWDAYDATMVKERRAGPVPQGPPPPPSFLHPEDLAAMMTGARTAPPESNSVAGPAERALISPDLVADLMEHNLRASIEAALASDPDALRPQA